MELLPPSISRTARLLEAMKAEGYDVGDLPEETGDGGFRFRLYVSGGKSFKSFTSTSFDLYLDLQSGTFNRVRRRTSNSGVFLDLVRQFFQVTLCGFSRLCILCGPHSFEGKPTTDAMILLAKCARLPVPLLSHSTGFSMAHTGSIRSV